MSLRIVPVTFRQSCAFIDTHHRHHRPPQGVRFAVGVADGTILVGVATTGRPVARHLDDGATAEVTRVATDDTRHANSKLYGACWRIARAMGYHRLVTYTQAGESGASLRAAGFLPAAHLAPHHGWDRPGRRRPADSGGIARTRWEIRTALFAAGDPGRPRLGGHHPITDDDHSTEASPGRQPDPTPGAEVLTLGATTRRRPADQSRPRTRATRGRPRPAGDATATDRRYLCQQADRRSRSVSGGTP